jgi:hypothetical protein
VVCIGPIAGVFPIPIDVGVREVWRRWWLDGFEAGREVIEPRHLVDGVEFASGKLTDFRNIPRESLGAEGVVNAGLRAKIRGSAPEFACKLASTSEHSRQVFWAHDDDRHDDHNDELGEAEAEHAIKLALLAEI